MTMQDCSMEGSGFGDIGAGMFDFTLDDLGVIEDEEKLSNWETELCVPQDSIEDLEWFPNFKDDFINLNSLCTMSGGTLLKSKDRALLKSKDEVSDERNNLSTITEDHTKSDSPFLESKDSLSSITEDHTTTDSPSLESKDEVNNERNSFSITTEDHTMADSHLLKHEDEVNYERKFPFRVLHTKKSRTKRIHNRASSWSSRFSVVTDKKLPRKRVVKADNANRRICSHCGADSTPQWRQGPMGPKTLCNACGVRYKTGRLVPEYRPLTSPSFDSQIHSNSHKKIMKMKKTLDVSNI